MSGFRVALLAAVLVAPGAAAAGDDGSVAPRVGKPGVYVVSRCGIVGYGATDAEARRAFPRAVRAARHGWSNMAKACGLLKLTDVVRIAPGQPPAFYVAGSRLIKGTDRQAVIRRCQQEEVADHKAHPEHTAETWECDFVRAAYGPFQRKPPWEEFDAEDAYDFLSEQGEWVNERGDLICFPAGTAVATPDGDRPIETLAAGSRVLSWSADRGAAVAARVLDVKRRRAHELLELTLADGRTLRVSANHPLFVPARNDWVPAGELGAGAELGVLTDGKLAPVAIKQVATRVVDVDVFDLTVETTHTYFAGGVLAHNY